MNELSSWAADLNRAADSLKARASQVVRKTGLDVEADAKVFAPVDTGNLRNSIGTTVTDGGLRVVIEATANYAVFVEYPTSRTPARPFLGPAVERNTPGFLEAIGQLADGS